MAYQRHTWVPGDQPTAALLNNIEDGISGADAKDAAIRKEISGISTRITQDETDLHSAYIESQNLISVENQNVGKVEASQNICFARGGYTGSGTTFTGYLIEFQPYVNLFSATATGGLTCLVAGTYFVQCDIFMTNTDATLNLRKNGTVVEGVARIQTNKSTAIGQRMMGFSLVTLAVGDVVSFAVTRSSATTDTGADLNIHLYKTA